jgi:hypothetical protein
VTIKFRFIFLSIHSFNRLQIKEIDPLKKDVDLKKKENENLKKEISKLKESETKVSSFVFFLITAYFKLFFMRNFLLEIFSVLTLFP